MNAPTVCIVPGYGIPRNEEQIRHLQTYLRLVKESLSQIQLLPREALHVVLSGGPTAFIPPYEDTEAGEMLKLLRSNVSGQVIFHLEEQAASTLENILYAKALLARLEIEPGEVIIFVENIRVNRMQEIVTLVLPKYKVRLIPVDLGHQADVAAQSGEKLATALLKWTLEKPANLAWYHDLGVEKVSAARDAYKRSMPFNNVEWWQTKWELIKDRLRRDGYEV